MSKEKNLNPTPTMTTTSRTNSVFSTPLKTTTGRPAPFTPKRTTADASSLTARLSRVDKPVLLGVTSTPLKKYKAPLSTEARRPVKVGLSPIPGSPIKRDLPPSRPKTPNSPMPVTSEMDVSNVDPEMVLVDSQTVEPGDLSGEIDETALNFDHGKEDKVMVSIRVRPTDSKCIWIAPPSTNSLKLDPAYERQSSSSTSFNFDAVLTGTPNKPIYSTVARSHVHAAMEGYNAVIFAYGQTASGKTYTLSGSDEEPGIIPRAMREVFGYIKRTPRREYLLRCSYLEIYNETVFDLLAPPVVAKANPVQIQGGTGGNEVILSPLREEVVTSLKGIKEVLRRGEGNRRTACTDWNERSSRSHSVFRLVIESRERGSAGPDDDDDYDVPSTMTNGRHTPGLNGRHTPGINGRMTPGLNGRQTPGPRLQARGGRSVQTSVLSLIDLAGSEKATSDKDRTREGKYINTSLLTLGTVIGTLAENASKNKADHIPYRNSKLTRMLQPSLAGNARISVVCTINPDPGALAESLSTLGFAKRVKSVQLNAKKKEVVDTEALLERYRKEIEELKARLAEREADAPVKNRRLSAREQMDESKATKDLNSRIEQLTKLILTSASVDETRDGESFSLPGSPSKIDFDMPPYLVQQELLAARLQIESQANQILSLEASLLARPSISTEGLTDEKDRLLTEQAKTIKELEAVVKAYEERGGSDSSAPIGEEERKVTREEIEKEWAAKVEEEKRVREEKERWAEEVTKALDKEKKTRQKLENERRALAAFVSKFDTLGLRTDKATTVHPKLVDPPLPSPGGALATFERRQSRKSFTGLSLYTRLPRISDVTIKPDLEDVSIVSEDLTGASAASLSTVVLDIVDDDPNSPLRNSYHRERIHLQALNHPRLLDQSIPEEIENCALNMSFDEVEVESQLLGLGDGDMSICLDGLGGMTGKDQMHKVEGRKREILGSKENLLRSGA